VAARPAQLQKAHAAAAVVETASAQIERAAPSLAGAEPLLNTAAAAVVVVVVVVVAALPAQAQAAKVAPATSSTSLHSMRLHQTPPFPTLTLDFAMQSPPGTHATHPIKSSWVPLKPIKGPNLPHSLVTSDTSLMI